MKSILYFLVLIACITVGCSSGAKGSETSANSTSMDTLQTNQNQIVWDGVYKGILPCEDCQGIETTLELLANSTYKLTSVYLGKEDLGSMTAQGPLDWSDDYRIIRLIGFENKPDQYLLGPNTLTQLNMSGNVTTGELADSYILRKQ